MCFVSTSACQKHLHSISSQRQGSLSVHMAHTQTIPDYYKWCRVQFYCEIYDFAISSGLQHFVHKKNCVNENTKHITRLPPWYQYTDAECHLIMELIQVKCTKIC